MSDERRIVKDYVTIDEFFDDNIPVSELNSFVSFVKDELSKLDGVIGTPHIIHSGRADTCYENRLMIVYERFEKDYEYEKRVAEEESKHAEEQRERSMLEKLKKKYEE